MNWAEIIALAALQGATEFLPISSSGHLVLAGSLLESTLSAEATAAFIVLLHSASICAVLVWFAKDIVALFRRPDRMRALGAIGLASTPAIVAAGALKLCGCEAFLEQLWIAGIAWIATAVLLFTTRAKRTRTWGLDEEGALPFGPVLWIGMAQAVAIVPGVSRSGATIAVALLLGMRRRDSFRFSFLLAIPIIVGAQIVEWGDTPSLLGSLDTAALAVGFVVCFAVSLGCLAWLQRVVLHKRLHWFAPYCLVIGCVALALGLS